jgi:hypothetical protein
MCKSKSGKFFLLLGVEHKPKKWNKKSKKPIQEQEKTIAISTEPR